MRKILNFLLVRRPEIKNKWWDRLFKVLLIGTSIILFIGVLGGTILERNQWTNYGNPYIFSLEKNYKEFDGREFTCNTSTNDIDINDKQHLWIMKCDGAQISYEDSVRYEGLERVAATKIYKELGLDKYSWDNCVGNTFGDRSDCIKEMIAAEKTDPAYPNYQNAIKNMPLHIKMTRNILFGSIFTDVAKWILIPIISVLLWIIFWNSIIYKSVLYIVFGKNNA